MRERRQTGEGVNGGLLQGTRVLDLTRVLAGPLCTMILGDLGAQVIKVERPGSGDESRGWGPPFDDRGQSAYYLCTNRNKLGIALDFDRRDDRDVLARLIGEADVVVDNFRAGVLEARGLGPELFLERHEALIWCTLSGFGLESTRPGYDFVVQAESGWMSVTGEADGEPMKSGIALADVLAGKDAAIAILAALAARGTGQMTGSRRLDISLARTATAALINVAQNLLVSSVDSKRWGNAHPNLVPYQLFRAADRSLVIAVGNDAQWVRCCRALGLDELALDESFATNRQRLARRNDVVERIAAKVTTAPAGDWISRLEARDVPCGLVRTVREAVADVSASSQTGVEPSIPGTVRFPPPLLDEHGPAIRASGFGVFGQIGA
ncbi:MAG: CaiB/BaiF CoA transferase family protein [Gemmatimonadota bacterium]